jgi:hypothetical protein
MESEREPQKAKIVKAFCLLASALIRASISFINSLLLILNCSLFRSKDLTNTSFSRKRRSLESEYYSVYFYLLNSRNYLLRKKEIRSEWYIKPRTIKFF